VRLSVLAAACLFAPGALADGAELFRTHCRTCHTTAPESPPGPGPSLARLSRVASDPGYGYSPALRAAQARGEVWSREKLARFLSDPDSLFPGQWMSATGVYREEDALQVADYLLTANARAD
jgi:cytochrome c